VYSSENITKICIYRIYPDGPFQRNLWLPKAIWTRHHWHSQWEITFLWHLPVTFELAQLCIATRYSHQSINSNLEHNFKSIWNHWVQKFCIHLHVGTSCIIQLWNLLFSNFYFVQRYVLMSLQWSVRLR